MNIRLGNEGGAQLIKELERLPEELLEEVSDFAAFVRKRRESQGKREGRWGDFSLSTGAFDFWTDPEEVEYSLDDLGCVRQDLIGASGEDPEKAEGPFRTGN